MAGTRYAKKTFITVPNKNTLQTVSGQAQAVFLWMCAMSDDDERCFPSYAYLSQLTGWSRNTIIKAVKELETSGMIMKTLRQRPNMKERLSNLYDVMIVDTESGSTGVLSYPQGSAAGEPHRGGGSAADAPPSAADAPPSAPEGRELKPVTKTTELKKEPDGQKSYKRSHADALAHLRALEASCKPVGRFNGKGKYSAG
jgi:DNA-binding transcriptional MocR family regulator